MPGLEAYRMKKVKLMKNMLLTMIMRKQLYKNGAFRRKTKFYHGFSKNGQMNEKIEDMILPLPAEPKRKIKIRRPRLVCVFCCLCCWTHEFISDNINNKESRIRGISPSVWFLLFKSDSPESPRGIFSFVLGFHVTPA